MSAAIHVSEIRMYLYFHRGYFWTDARRELKVFLQGSRGRYIIHVYIDESWNNIECICANNHRIVDLISLFTSLRECDNEPLELSLLNLLCQYGIPHPDADLQSLIT